MMKIKKHLDNYYKHDDIWYENPEILIEKEKIIQFFPMDYMTYNEKINSLVRVAIVVALILTLLKKDYRYLNIILITLIVTYYFHNTINNGKKDKYDVYSGKFSITNMKENNINTLYITHDFVNIFDNDFYQKCKRIGINILNDRINFLDENLINKIVRYNLKIPILKKSKHNKDYNNLVIESLDMKFPILLRTNKDKTILHKLNYVQLCNNVKKSLYRLWCWFCWRQI